MLMDCSGLEPGWIALRNLIGCDVHRLDVQRFDGILGLHGEQVG